jgi:hypothetical protein
MSNRQIDKTGIPILLGFLIDFFKFVLFVILISTLVWTLLSDICLENTAYHQSSRAPIKPNKITNPDDDDEN